MKRAKLNRVIERAEHVGGLTADSGLRVGRWRGVQCLKETVKIRGSRINPGPASFHHVC